QVGGEPLGASGVKIDAGLIDGITIDGPHYELEIVLSIPSPFAGIDNLSPFNQPLQFSLSWKNSTKRWRVNGKSLPWFSDQAKEITGDMDDWCKKEKSFTLHLEHDYPLKHLGLCTANEDVDKSNMGFFVVQDDFSHFLTFVFVPFLKNFWGFGKDNLGQIT